MSVFSTGLTVLFIGTAIFYIVIFSFIFFWHLKKISFIVLPLLFTFEFFIMGFFAIAIISIILQYLPVLIGASGI